MKNRLLEHYYSAKKSRGFLIGAFCLFALMIVLDVVYFSFVRTHVTYFRNVSFACFQMLGYPISMIVFILLYLIYSNVYCFIYWRINRK